MLVKNSLGYVKRDFISTMRKLQYLVIFGIVNLLFSSGTYAGNKTLYAVINASNDITEMPVTKMARIFLGKQISFANGLKIVPIDHPLENSSNGLFTKYVIHKSNSQLNSYWSRKIFNGKGCPPIIVSGMDNYLKYIAENENSIGYIYGEKKVDSKKIKFLPLVGLEMVAERSGQ